MQIIQIQRGSIEARNNSSIKLARGELFLNNINKAPELLAGLGNGKYEKVGGMGGLSFVGKANPAELTSLLNGTKTPTKNGVYVLKGGDIDLSTIAKNFLEPNEDITLFNGYSLTDKLYDGDILAYVKAGALGDQNAYSWVKIVGEKSLKVAFDTKADLDPATGKVLLSQIPDTIAGGMDYQGFWSKKELPTVNAGKDNDSALNSAIETHKDLAKGDYWIYTGEDWDITNVAKIIQKGEKENNDKYWLKNGDYLVYNGDETWGVIDNTDAFLGIKVSSIINGESEVFDGIFVIFDYERENGLMETVTTVKDNGVQISTPNATLVSDDDIAAPGTLYKEKNGNKVLEPSGISEDTVSATIDESNAQINVKSSEYGRTTELRTNKDGDEETVLVYPKTSSILLGTNSIIDCGEWTMNEDGTIKFECTEGEVSKDYMPSVAAYKTQGTLGAGGNVPSDPTGGDDSGDTPEEPENNSYYATSMVTTDINIIVGKYEVTRALYKEIMGEDPSAEYPMTADEGDARPVDNVTLAQAREFCNKLSLRDGLTPAYDDNGVLVSESTGYRLPYSGETVNFGQAGQDTEFGGTNGSLENQGNDGSYDVFIGEPIAYETNTAGKQVPVYDDTVATRPVEQSDLQSWVNPWTTSRANVGDTELSKYAWTKYNVRTGEPEKVPQPLSAVANADWTLFKYNGVYYKSNAYGWAAARGNIDDAIYGTHAVGTRLPNALGIYDTTGNVSELYENGDDRDGYGGDVAANTSKIGFNVGTRESKVIGFRVVLNKSAINYIEG